MGAQREHYERWFASRRGPRNLHDETAALEAADAYDSMRLAGERSQQGVDLIIAAARNPHRLVWNCASDLLTKSIREWPELADIVAAVLKDRSATARFSAMCCVNRFMPSHVADAMISAGLLDKSGEVRWKAGDAANRLKRTELIPLLEEAAAAEKPGRVRRSLDDSLRRLRDGYVLDPMDDDSYSLSIDTATGSVGRLFTKSEVELRGIPALIAELRACD